MKTSRFSNFPYKVTPKLLLRGILDLIFANPPLLPAEPETLLEKAVADSPEMSLTQEFIRGAAKHVKPSGRIYMAFSNACKVYVGDPLAFVGSIAEDAGLRMSIKAEWDVGYELYRILEFKPRERTRRP